MEVLYSRHRLEGALASEYDAFVDAARGGHYMQTCACPVQHYSPRGAAFLERFPVTTLKPFSSLKDLFGPK